MTAAVTDLACQRRGCGQPLIQRPGEAPSEFRNRRFCSQSCYSHRNVPAGQEQQHTQHLMSRECPTCGAFLVRKPGEVPADWKRRKFCDKACSQSANRLVKALKAPLVAGELDWQARGLCRGTHDLNWSARDSSWEENERLRSLADRFCRGCPVRQMCQDRADRESDGVWGGVVVRTVAGRLRRENLLAPVEGLAS